MALFHSLLIILIFLALSLILPIIIVLKWLSRPVWAMFSACVLYCLPLILVIVASVYGGHQEVSGAMLWLGSALLTFIWLIPGFLVLILIQWWSRKRRARRAKSAIEEAF